MHAITTTLKALWHGAGAFALVVFLQQLSPLSEHWILASNFAWLAPVLVALLSAFTTWAKNQELTEVTHRAIPRPHAAT